jgi:hypothetical protein
MQQQQSNNKIISIMVPTQTLNIARKHLVPQGPVSETSWAMAVVGATVLWPMAIRVHLFKKT